MKIKNICWITPDCFIDVDMPVISILVEDYNIHWIIQFGETERYKEKDFEDLIQRSPNLSVEFLYFRKRMRNPLNILDYDKIRRIIHRKNPDIVYSDMSINSPWKIPLVKSLPYCRTIFAAHQGRLHEGMNRLWLLKIVRDFTYKHVTFIHMFSKSQAAFMHETYPHPYIFQFPLPLKDFGEPTNERPNDGIIRFTSFGRLVHVKKVELLIDAACNLYEKGYKNIRVIIKGACDDWDYYKAHIRYPEIFEIDIRMIENREIPNLFNSTHFFVQPYSVVTQSGPMKIAFRYNVPLITSNLPGFMDEMKDGVTGFIFESGNVRDLEKVMIKAIQIHSGGGYEDLRGKMKEYVSSSFSKEKVVRNYMEMFNYVINQI